MTLDLPDLHATESLGARIAGVLRPGDAVLLSGPLGAGKSALARAVLRTLLADPALDVPSPSYTLVQAYDAPWGTVWHFDLWRLDDPRALEELGWDGAQDDAVIVEWPDRLPAPPLGALHITLALAAGDARRATLDGWAERVGWAEREGWAGQL